MQELKINIPVYGWTIRKKTNAINCGHENLLRHFFFLLLAINVYLDRSILNEVIATWLYMVIPSDLDTVINKFNK